MAISSHLDHFFLLVLGLNIVDIVEYRNTGLSKSIIREHNQSNKFIHPDWSKIKFSAGKVSGIIFRSRFSKLLALFSQKFRTNKSDKVLKLKH